MTILEDHKVMTGHGIIELIDNSYVKLETHPHIKDFTLKYLKEDIEAFKFLTKGNKYAFISVIPKLTKFDPECDKFMRDNVHKYFNIQAVITENKLAINFINLALMFKKLEIDTKLFTNIDDALVWINKKLKNE